MEGFLSDFIRDLLSVLDVLLSIIGILLAILFWLYPPKRIWASLDKYLSPVFYAVGQFFSDLLKECKQVKDRANNTIKILTASVPVVSIHTIKVAARFVIVVGAPIFALVTITLLYRSWERWTSVRREAESVARCERFEYRLARVQDEYSFGARTLELSCSGRRVYQGEGFFLSLRAFDRDGVETHVRLDADQQEVRGTIPAHDITGDGAPDILLDTHSGGTCCGPEHELVSLGTEAKTVVKIEQTKYEEEAQFADLDGDGIYEIQRDDVLFRDYGTHGDAFATFPIILAMRDGEYRVEPHLMRQPPPSESELRRMAEAVRAVPLDEENTSIYRRLMELAYKGNGYEAQKLVDLVLADLPESDRHSLWREFKIMLANSDYWPDLAAMNGWDRELSEYAGEQCPY